MKRWQQQEWIGWDEARIWEGSTALFRKLILFGTSQHDPDLLEINDLHVHVIFRPSGHETEANKKAPPIKIANESAAGTTLDISTKSILSKEGMSSSHPRGPAECSET